MANADTTTHQTAKTQYLTAGDVTYAYRRFGNETTTAPPLVFFIHFRGTMDHWDPLLINTLAATRPIILFDNAGVGKSTGTVPPTIPLMAASAITFLTTLLPPSQPIDLLGFSMGGLIAPLVYLNAPSTLSIRKLILAGTTVSAGPDIIPNSASRAATTTQCASGPRPTYDNCFATIFFLPSATSQAAGRAWWARIHERSPATSGGETRSEFVSYDYADGGAGVKAMAAAGKRFGEEEWKGEGSYDRLDEIKVPVLVAQGRDDFMIPSVNSWVMAQRIEGAKLIVYPDSGHGFLYQHAKEFSEDVVRFLSITDD